MGFEQSLASFVALSINFIAYLIGRRSFLPLSLPFFKTQFLWSRVSKKLLRLKLRNSIDFEVFRQVFIEFQYETSLFQQGQKLRQLFEIDKSEGSGSPLILDLGANNGMSSAYFLEKWPGSKVVGVEPHQGNFEIASINSPYAEFVFGAASSRDGRVQITNEGDEFWGFRVKSAASGGVPSFSLPSLIARYSNHTPFILKIDIEGSEAELFEGDCSWISEFPLIIIEPHDWMLPEAGTSSNFLRAISRHKRDFLIRGENIFSFRN